MQNEISNRLTNFYNSEKCTFNEKKVKLLMTRFLPKGAVVETQAAIQLGKCAKEFLAELIEISRTLTNVNEFITPDLINIAYDIMLKRGRVPYDRN